jgi:hypothetical protein
MIGAFFGGIFVMYTRVLSFIQLSWILFGCGSEVPDLAGSRRSDNGEVAIPSSEIAFDLQNCGFDTSKPAAIFESRRLTMVPQPMTMTTGEIFSWQVQTSLNGNSIFEESLQRSVGTYSAQFSPTVQSPAASEILANHSAGFAADLLPPAERAKIGELYEDWRGVFCSFQPAIHIVRGSTEKVSISLDKPLPLAPVLQASLERLKSEIGVKRVWRQITANVTDSTDPNVPAGSSWTGVVHSQPVASSVALVGPNGKTTISADMAVRTTYDFGGESANKAMGLPRSVTWFIDTNTRSFKLVQVDFGVGVLTNYLP